MNNIKNIATERIHPHPDNPRKDLGDLTELAESIKVNGVLQNLTVVPDEPDNPDTLYTVVIGHRRLAGATMAGVPELPCAVVEMTPAEQVKTMLMENMQRADLTVYEQAQGFQMMLNMGGTIQSVAQDTGFSEATVRHRVKMMELDQTKLKEVADDEDRQIRLADFDELAKIEDIKARNKALADIGTNNFKSSVRAAIQTQEKKRRKPLAMKWLKSVGAQEIKSNDAYGSRYEHIGASYYFDFYNWKEDEMPDVSKLEGGLFYCLGCGGDYFSLYTKAKKKPKEKKSKAQREKEQKIREAWKTIDDASGAAYELRKAFTDGVVMGSKNKVSILTGAVYAAMLESVDWNSMDRDGIIAVLGVETKSYDPQRMMKAWNAYAKVSPKDMAKLVYAFFGDGHENCTGRNSRSEWPKYERSAKLEMLYNWLWELGYVMSDEETAMLNGTHEVYKDPYAPDEEPQGQDAAEGDGDGDDE